MVKGTSKNKYLYYYYTTYIIHFQPNVCDIFKKMYVLFSFIFVSALKQIWVDTGRGLTVLYAKRYIPCMIQRKHFSVASDNSSDFKIISDLKLYSWRKRSAYFPW